MTATLKTDLTVNHLCEDVKGIIDDGVRSAYASVDQIALMTFWKVGR